MKRVKLIVALVLAVLLIIIIFQNTETVETRILFFKIGMPRFLLLLVAMLIGFAIGLVAAERIGRIFKKNK